MNAKLVYLYIKDINRPFENLEFTFTNDFKIQFNPDNSKIIIEKNDETIQNFWGENINSIDVIIGRNGSGKSTLLDLLAQNRMNRDNLFNENKKKVEWFVIYHTSNNKFIIEGSNYKILPIIKINDRLDKQYSIVCSYDSKVSKFKYLDYIQNCTWDNNGRETSIEDSLIFLYDTASAPVKSWVKNNIRRFDDNSSFSFKRHYVSYPSYQSIYRFINSVYGKIEKELFSAQNVMCEITSNILYDKIDIQDTFRLNLYSDGELLKFRLSNNFLRASGNSNLFFDEFEINLNIKQQYIIVMLENIIMNLWMDRVTKKEEDSKKFKKFNDEWIGAIAQKIYESAITLDEDFDAIKKHLYHVIEILYTACNEKYQRNEINSKYVESIRSFTERLLDLNHEFFITHNLVKIPVNRIYDAKVDELLNIYDSYIADDETRFSDLKTLINMKYTNLSTGEFQFLDRFSSLYETINKKSDYYIKNMIICLDEPEGTFHPEWARKYIYYLVKFLDFVNLDKNLTFQIIIATHSPFIVSDIPKQNINCIQFFEDQNSVINRSVQKANFGFASNLYDIVGDDFFVKSSIGEFASEKLNEILRRIMELTKTNIGESIKEIKQTIELIGDPVIKNKLMYLLKEKETQLLPDMDEKDRRILELEKEIARLRENINDKN